MLEINSRTDCREHALRDRVQRPEQAQGVTHIKKAIADWETSYNEYLDSGGEKMNFKERRSQILRLPPSGLRRDLFRVIGDYTDISEVKEWIRRQVELEQEWEAEDRSRRPSRKTPLQVTEQEDEYDLEELREIFPDKDDEEIHALGRKFGRYKGKRPPPGQRSPTRPTPSGDRRAPPARLPGATRADDGRCANCGSKEHIAKHCPKPQVNKSDRPCFRCGRTGHFSVNCPQAGGPGSGAAAKTLTADDVISFNCLECCDPGWTVVKGTRRPSEKENERVDQSFECGERGDFEGTTRKKPVLADFISENLFDYLNIADQAGEGEDTGVHQDNSGPGGHLSRPKDAAKPDKEETRRQGGHPSNSGTAATNSRLTASPESPFLDLDV